jgi:hypothetical protein
VRPLPYCARMRRVATMLHPKPWNKISDEDVVRELDQVHARRHDVFRAGSAAAWDNHLARTAQLEAEYLRRFTAEVHDAEEKLQLYANDSVSAG